MTRPGCPLVRGLSQAPAGWRETPGRTKRYKTLRVTMAGMIEIDRLRPDDRAAWEVLARGYKAFYHDPETDEAYEATWRRLADGTELHAFGARLDGRLIGLAHY